MRLPFAIPVLVSLSLAAASPWEDLQARLGQTGLRTSRWSLCLRTQDAAAQDFLGDEAFQRLATGNDLGLEFLRAAEAKDLWALKKWGPEAHWILLSPRGEEAASGPGRPTGEAILEAIRGAGGTSRWDHRDRFLKENPRQGEALVEAFAQSLRLVRARYLALQKAGKVKAPAQGEGAQVPLGFSRLNLGEGPEAASLADDLYQEAAGILARMIDLPGWEKEAQRLLIQINFWDFSQSSRLRELFGRAAQDLERKLQADPQDPNLAALWAESMDISGHSLAGATGSFAPAPGRVWPSRVLLNRILEPLRRKQDWDGVLKLLAELAPQGPPDPVTPRAWDEYRRLQATILANQALTLASQGAWDQAGAVLEDARRWGGPEAVRMALLLRNGPWTGNRANQATWRLMVSEALSREGEGAPMPPVRPPLRLTVMGMPRWILEWTALNRHQDLAPWAPSELTWSVLAPAEHRQLQQRFAWGPGPRWALFRGEELLATGETCPTPQALAATLEGEGPSMLQRLNRFLALHPDHQGARRDRFQLLLRRMPDSRLEPLLAEDAGETGVVLNFTPQAPWKPDPERWGAAAMKVLPRIEEELRHWPERRSLWRAWIAWAPFHPARPSILTVVQGLPFWSPRADWRTELPLEVQRAVADDFRRQGAYMAMREWFRASWEAMDRRPRYDLRRGEREWVLDRRQDEEAAVVQPLRESLAVLGCTEELAEVDRAWREMTGKTPGRKP